MRQGKVEKGKERIGVLVKRTLIPNLPPHRQQAKMDPGLSAFSRMLAMTREERVTESQKAQGKVKERVRDHAYGEGAVQSV